MSKKAKKSKKSAVKTTQTAKKPIRRAGNPTKTPTGGSNTFYTARGKVAINGYDAWTQLKDSGAVAVNGNSPSMQDNRTDIISYSRSFYRNNCIYKGMIDRLVTHIIGSGFSLQVMSKNVKYNQEIEARFKEYWKKPEIKNLLSGLECERMMMREALICGDTGTTLLNIDSKIQMVEAEQISNSLDYRDSGVKTNEFGVVEGFYVSPYGKYGQVDTKSAKYVDAKDFCFVADLDRPSSLRGMPISVASFPNINRLNDLLDSECVSAQLLSRMALSITKKATNTEGEIGVPQDDYDPPPTSATPNVTDFEWGTIFEGEPGDEIKSVDRDIPGKNFPENVRMYLRMIGLPASMPLELLLLDWTKSNYSQSKAVMNQFSATTNAYQDMAIQSWYNPIFERFIQNEVATGNIKSRDDFAYSWIKAKSPQLDPLKETEANIAQIEAGNSTFAEVLKNKGVDPENHINKVLQEDIYAELKRQEFEKATGQTGSANRYKGMKDDPAYTSAEETNEGETDVN